MLCSWVLLMQTVSLQQITSFEFRSAGLPVGIQLIGQAWREADLFFLASVIEATVGSRLRVPAMHFNILK